MAFWCGFFFFDFLTFSVVVRFDLELYPRHAKLVGSNPYRIPYENVTRMYHLPHPKGENTVCFILSMDPAIRRGQTLYHHIIMELPTDDHLLLDLTLTEEQLNQYKGQLNHTMKGKQSSVIARLFKTLTDKKVTIPGGSFKSTVGTAMVPCSVGASTGHLYLLERSIFFIDKPAINIPYEQIDQVEFLRHSQITSNRNFDLEVRLKSGKSVHISGRPKSSVTFAHIAREERNNIISMFRQKDISMSGLREERDDVGSFSDEGSPQSSRKRAAEGVRAGDDDEEENDSSFGSEKSSSSDDLEYASKASSESSSGDDEKKEEGGERKKPKKEKDEDSE